MVHCREAAVPTSISRRELARDYHSFRSPHGYLAFARRGGQITSTATTGTIFFEAVCAPTDLGEEFHRKMEDAIHKPRQAGSLADSMLVNRVLMKLSSWIESRYSWNLGLKAIHQTCTKAF